MANLTIKDSGYVRVAVTDTDVQEALIANSGTPIELKSVSIVYERGANISAPSQPGKFDDIEGKKTSSSAPVIVISGELVRGAMDGTGTDIMVADQLDALCTTRGVKCVYYNDTETGEAGYPIITKAIGKPGSDYSGHPVEKHFHVDFRRFRLTQTSGKGTASFTLEGVVVG
jgi:hypothetical protein